MDELIEFLRCATSSLADKPASVVISIAIHSGNNVVYLLECPKDEIPKIIGSNGRNINAIKTLLHAIAAKNKVRASLVIKE